MASSLGGCARLLHNSQHSMPIAASLASKYSSGLVRGRAPTQSRLVVAMKVMEHIGGAKRGIRESPCVLRYHVECLGRSALALWKPVLSRRLLALIHFGFDLGYMKGADPDTTRLQLQVLPPLSEASSAISTKTSAKMYLKGVEAQCKNQLHVAALVLQGTDLTRRALILFHSSPRSSRLSSPTCSWMQEPTRQ